MKKERKNNFTKLTRNRKGISLITLVITIIVIIILAAAIVMSLNNNNIITNASSARYESDRDYIQSALELAIQKVVLRHKGGIELEVGAINQTAKDVKLVDGKVIWTSKELAGLSGEIIFDEGQDTETKFYVGEKLPVYGSQTTWYVDEQGKVVLQIANKIFGAEKVPKGKITANQIMENPSEYYGKTVKYETEKGANYEWQIFHADEGGIYLITKDYIKREDIPNSWKNGSETTNKPNDGSSSYARSAYFRNILSDYENGSEDVKESMKSLNSRYFIDKGYVSAYPNMKAVAYMLDTSVWSKYADEKANWAIGGPSLELMCKSYNAYRENEVLEYEAPSAKGYTISKDGGNLSFYLDNVFTKNDANGMYIIESTGNARGYWLSSPSSHDSSYIMRVNNNGLMGDYYCNGNELGFRPLVYLKFDIKLKELEDKFIVVI